MTEGRVVLFLSIVTGAGLFIKKLCKLDQKAARNYDYKLLSKLEICKVVLSFIQTLDWDDPFLPSRHPFYLAGLIISASLYVVM